MIEIELRIESMANLREHYMARARRAKAHRECVGWSLKTTKKPELPVVVTLTRIAPRRLDDDNAIGGLKSARDGVADWLGIDDADGRVTWLYRQEAQPKRFALRIEFSTPLFEAA